jgi:hypothetical protein
MAGSIVPLFPKFLVRFKYNSIDRIAAVGCPVLVVHSRDDNLVPYEHGRRLFEAAREPKWFLELEGSHNGGYLLCVQQYTAALDSFFRSVF